MDKIPMTPAGHAALTEEYRVRTSEERPRIVRDISEARAHGDLSENAEYHAAKEQQSLNEGRIQELEALLALADIIDIKKLSGSTVKFGATVKIVDEESEESKTYAIVGDAEADASKGRISISSPIARAMIGKSKGDSFEVISEPTDLTAVRTALQDAGIEYDSADASFQPSVSVPVDLEGARKVLKLVDALEDSDDVQDVWTNVDISDEVAAQLDED